MPEPIVFVSHFHVKEGKRSAYRQLQEGIASQLMADKPRTSVFLAYLDSDGTAVTAIHVFADAESMDIHFEGSEERSERAHDVLLPGGWDIYGAPSDPVIETMRRAAAAAGVPLTVHSDLVAGFVRGVSTA